MGDTALVTGTDRGLGYAMAQNLLDHGWTVVAGHLDRTAPSLTGPADRLIPIRVDVANDYSVAAFGRAVGDSAVTIDVVINNAAILGLPTVENSIRDGLDYQRMMETISVNAAGPLRVVQAVLPFMRAEGRRRLCFVSSEAGSVSRSRRTDFYGYCMSKSALNMGVSILYNDLRRDGFTFRIYHPGWIRSYMFGEKNLDAALEPEEAAAAALGYFLNENGSVDENRLILRDFEGEEWPW